MYTERAEHAWNTECEPMKNFLPLKLRRDIGRSVRNLRRKSWPSFGIDFPGDVKTRLPSLKVRTIFDVGANIGMTALEFSDAFPDAVVYAFEPNGDNLKRLQSNLTGKPEVLPQFMALGKEAGSGHLLIVPDHPSTHRLVKAGSGSTEIVRIGTVDQFCADNGIDDIDFMKIDVEGYEIQVLEGARSMLSSASIGLIKMECAVDPDSTYHTQFIDICEVLHPLGYRLFSIYEQCEDFMTPIQQRLPRLKRFDCVFISPQLQQMTGRTFDPHSGKGR